MRHSTPNIFLTAVLTITSLLQLGLAHTAQAEAACSDVALVLAIDVSASVSPGEFLLEKRGIAAAFRDPAVLRAIEQAGRFTVSAVFWGDDKLPRTQSDWILIDSSLNADQFAQSMEDAPRTGTGDTGLAAGMGAALAKLMSPDVCAVRKIINVSGDGEESRAVRGEHRSSTPSQVKDLASKAHVEINALSISSDEPALAEYYARNVVTGPEAFVIDVHAYSGFAEAIRRKLIREISPRAVSEIPVVHLHETVMHRQRS